MIHVFNWLLRAVITFTFGLVVAVCLLIMAVIFWREVYCDIGIDLWNQIWANDDKE